MKENRKLSKESIERTRHHVPYSKILKDFERVTLQCSIPTVVGTSEYCRIKTQFTESDVFCRKMSSEFYFNLNKTVLPKK